MKTIKSMNAFKTSYIADIKERLGFKVRVSPRRKNSERKIKCPDFHAKFISEAIKILQKEGKPLTYRNIQEKAFKLYQKAQSENKVKKYFNSIKVSKSLSKEDIKDILDSEVFELES
ncbi:hypothetical protein [Persephonella sp.]|uniref:hypothetical protein n=1 Tax=Persephonella sp. TaxID=2060922 RepID=UPI00261F6182|nr:hypothetical protein [Persephonella sp.]